MQRPVTLYSFRQNAAVFVLISVSGKFTKTKGNERPYLTLNEQKS